MSQTLDPIPIKVPITDQAGIITEFFRLRWEQLRSAVTRVGTAGSLSKDGQTAALTTTTIAVTTVAGRYLVPVYLRKTVADGVSSSLTPTVGWTESGIPLSSAGAAMTTDSVTSPQGFLFVIDADAATNITLSVAYASNTPARMTWRGRADAVLLS